MASRKKKDLTELEQRVLEAAIKILVEEKGWTPEEAEKFMLKHPESITKAVQKRLSKNKNLAKKVLN